MAGVFVTVELNLLGKSIADLNDKVYAPANKHDVINGVINALMAAASGAESATVKVVVKDAASTINTSGTGSTSETYT